MNQYSGLKGVCMLLKEGQKAPDFVLPSNLNKYISLNDLVGRRVILYFYPKDSTHGCTVEAREFQSLKNDFEKNNTVILGVSKDSIKSHNKFAEKECLSFLLLSDETGKVCNEYGVWVEKNMYGKKYMGITRTTFFIDECGNIVKIWSNINVAGHASTVLRFVIDNKL